jgi:hypothetical protein
MLVFAAYSPKSSHFWRSGDVFAEPLFTQVAPAAHATLILPELCSLMPIAAMVLRV